MILMHIDSGEKKAAIRRVAEQIGETVTPIS